MNYKLFSMCAQKKDYCIPVMYLWFKKKNSNNNIFSVIIKMFVTFVHPTVISTSFQTTFQSLQPLLISKRRKVSLFTLWVPWTLRLIVLLLYFSSIIFLPY